MIRSVWGEKRTREPHARTVSSSHSTRWRVTAWLMMRAERLTTSPTRLNSFLSSLPTAPHHALPVVTPTLSAAPARGWRLRMLVLQLQCGTHRASGAVLVREGWEAECGDEDAALVVHQQLTHLPAHPQHALLRRAEQRVEGQQPGGSRLLISPLCLRLGGALALRPRSSPAVGG